ncbi:MAG: glycosyltransferase [Candidatus Roizmanbacteria bacterium]|nr:glycosyltransferase [Candidatus Roizmanbacteria bacterium]
MISVVIPHYKGKEKLYSNLKHNLPFFKDCEIIVVNDYTEVSITGEMKQLFPEVVVIENKKNLGFAGAVVVGINHSKSPYVFLLNNDVVLKDDSFKSALTHFQGTPSLFAVSFKQIEKDEKHVGRNKIYWSHGFFRHSKGDPGTHGINGWAEGGSMVFDKKKYEELHGFDTLYSPFYWEDIDLSYRAWKAGYTIHFDSHVLVEHHHESTIATYFQKSKIETIAYRNQFITIWKNISDFQYIAEHIMYLIKNLITYPLKGQLNFVNGFWMALLLLPQIIKKKNQQKKLWKKSDKEIFEKFNLL